MNVDNIDCLFEARMGGRFFNVKEAENSTGGWWRGRKNGDGGL